MTYESFLKVLLTLEKQNNTINQLNILNVNLIDFVEPYYNVIFELIKTIYGEEGYEWFSWYCYENDFGTKDWSKNTYGKNKTIFGAHDENGNPICYSHESLYNFLEKYKIK